MFFAIKNLTDHTVRKIESPWEIENKSPYDLTKAEYKKWSLDPSTDHIWISLCEGHSASVRITADENEVHMVHGIIADYDAAPPNNVVEHLKKNGPKNIRLPNWVCATQSGYCRLIWIFEAPFRVVGTDHYAAFMRHVMDVALKLEKWLAGLDTGRINQPNTYYELGCEWQRVSEEKIPDAVVHSWDHIAFLRSVRSQSMSLDGVDVMIPMEKIAAEVEARFPGRWTGEFKKGARGVRFWDSTADHPAGIMVCDGGCRVFTPHDKPFMSWLDIFSRKFVETFIGDRTKSIRDHSYWDGRAYWYEHTPGNWQMEAPEQFAQVLRVRGFSSKTPKDKTCSEIDEIMLRVRQENTVSGAYPVIYKPVGLMEHPDNGSRVLNTKLIMPIAPAAPRADLNTPWSEGHKLFPFIHEILSNMFVDADQVTDRTEWLKNHVPDIQLATLLHWMRRSYMGGLAQNPSVGQSMIIVGGVDKGKTLINRWIIGKLLGGSADGSEALINGTRFNGDVTCCPVLRIDDPETTDRKTRKAFEMRVKKLVANGTTRTERKYREAVDVPWCVRIVMTCNDDPESSKMLPGLTSSNKDKVILLRCGDRRMKFHQHMSDNESRIMAELPHFGRWLVDWQPPPETVGSARYGVKPYHHASVMTTIEDQGLIGTFLDVFDKTFNSAPPTQAGETVFRGTSLELFELLSATCPGAMKMVKPQSIKTILTIMRNNGWPVEKDDLKDSIRRTVWSIPYDLHSRNSKRVASEAAAAALPVGQCDLSEDELVHYDTKIGQLEKGEEG